MNHTHGDIVIIGGGVIGLYTAYYAAKEGGRVIVLEKGRIPCGASYGNAGLIVPGHVEPLPVPGVQWEGLLHHFNPKGAFSIGFVPEFGFLTWLYRFHKSCNEKQYVKAVHLFRRLNGKSAELYNQLPEKAGEFFEYDTNGTMKLYMNPKHFEEDCKKAAELENFGIFNTRLSGKEVCDKDPSVSKEIAGGFFCPSEGKVNPAAMLVWLKDEIVSLGGVIMEETEVYGFDVEKNADGKKRVSLVLTTKGNFTGDQMVVAAGAYTGNVMKLLGGKAPVLGNKGYSMTFERENNGPKYPALLHDAYVAVTPMNNRLRMTGFLELSGLNMTIKRKRLDIIRQNALRYYTGMGPLKLLEVWRGHRPTTPDGVPIIGAVGGTSNLYVASGHTSKGITLGPVTGKIMADMLSGKENEPYIASFSPDRF